MSTHTYKELINKAQTCHNNVKKNYKLGINYKWSYYFAKAILKPKTDIPKSTFKDCKNPTGTHISRQISKTNYLKLAKNYITYIEKHKQFPNYATYGEYHIRPRVLTIFFADILLSYNKNGELPSKMNINSRCFTKPSETKNEVYNYFVKVFGKFDNTIDGALSKIDGNGYGGYSDDRYSNKTSIDRMKNGQGINCTDSCHVFYNIMKQLIALGKYKKVECLHVRCSSGVGHVRLRITMNDGTKILRDPASVLDGNGIRSNWCTSNFELWAIDPSWFMENLNR